MLHGQFDVIDAVLPYDDCIVFNVVYLVCFGYNIKRATYKFI